MVHLGKCSFQQSSPPLFFNSTLRKHGASLSVLNQKNKGEMKPLCCISNRTWILALLWIVHCNSDFFRQDQWGQSFGTEDTSLCDWGCTCVGGTQKSWGEGHRVTLHADSATLNIPSALGDSFPPYVLHWKHSWNILLRVSQILLYMRITWSTLKIYRFWSHTHPPPCHHRQDAVTPSWGGALWPVFLMLSRQDWLEKGMATHSSILDWRIPWTEEPGEVQSVRSQSWTGLSD